MKQIPLLVMFIFSLFAAPAQNVGIGTSTPQSELHLHSASSSSTLQLTNNITTAANNRGSTLRMLGGNLFLNNRETAGSLNIALDTDPGLTLVSSPNNYLGWGTSSPQRNFHVHQQLGGAAHDVSIAITNSNTVATGSDGARLRMLDNNFILQNNEAVGDLRFTTNAHFRMMIKPIGFIGINEANPQALLHLTGETFPITTNEVLRLGGGTPYMSFYDGAVFKGYLQAALGGFEIGSKSAQSINFYTNDAQQMTILNNGNVGINVTNPTAALELNSNASTFALKANGPIRFTGIGTPGGANKYLTGNSSGDLSWNSLETDDVLGALIFGSIGVASSTTGNLVSFYVYGSTNAFAGGSVNSTGIGLVSTQDLTAPSTITGISAGVGGVAATGYGVYARSTTGASLRAEKLNDGATTGTVAEFINNKPGITQAVVLAQAQNNQPALELNNGTIKVSGANRFVFQHTTTAANITGNETIIPNTSLANSAGDLLIITPVWEGVYLNAAIGVYFSAGSWRIFRQDLVAMPLGIKFNVLVVKQ
jgi:hypothetical protein